ncbi:MAG: hypothetical protein V2I37_13005 [Marinilabiliaceae bacterium]|jgi:hypothetical protein|nr:hypothetical protein [Marinilabiliaceae bacterium]
MKHRTAYTILILILYAHCTKAQEFSESSGIWHFRKTTGELNLNAGYRTLSTQLNELDEFQNTGTLFGGLQLNSSSYMWNPDIISFNFSGEYSPDFRDENYIKLPDRSEVRTLSRINLITSVFNNKPLTLNNYINFNRSYFNRDNLTNVHSTNKQWGINLAANNRILPVSISYRELSWNQRETDTGREFHTSQKNLEAKSSKSFFGNDKNELKYTYRDYSHSYSELSTTRNSISRLDFISQVFFDPSKKYGLNSNIYYLDQEGSYSFTRFELNERLILNFRSNLKLGVSYNYYDMKDPEYSIKTNKVRSQITHRLFESLNSQAYFNFTGTSHSLYKETSLISGTRINYTKKTKAGVFSLGYHFFNHKNNVDGDNGTIEIQREEHSLIDAEITTLDRPYANETTVVVTDLSSTVIYQEGLDYQLNVINDFIEIIRIPGGQITNNQAVLISYNAIQPGSYNYSSTNNSLTSGLMLFQRHLEIYYRGIAQKYPSASSNRYLTLNTYYQNIAGLRLYIKNASAGIEYDYYNSSIIPYKKYSYYINLNFKLRERMLLALNSSLRDYKLLDTDVNHLYSNISARISVAISQNSKINFEGGYLKQSGQTINLDLLSGKIEYIAVFRKLTLRGGINMYKRQYSESNFLYTGSQIEITRKF